MCERNPSRNDRKIKSSYDFIICGAGVSGSVVAGRLAENPDVRVLLLEAGDDASSLVVMDSANWMHNIGSARDWCFKAEPNMRLNGRSLHLAMGKGLGGGASINGMIWSRGHRGDWDYLAAEAGDPAWNYESILEIYKCVEDWRGRPDPQRRGVGGPVYVQPLPEPHPIARAFTEAAGACGIPAFEDSNGEMMEGAGGCALLNVTLRGDRRASIFGAYVNPAKKKPNLTIAAGATVTRLLFQGLRTTGVEFRHNGRLHTVSAAVQVVVSLGAINTPKLLMQSGIGDKEELERHGIRVYQHLPGVGRNYQDHFTVAGCAWQAKEPLPFGANGGGATVFWKGKPTGNVPNIQLIQAMLPYLSDGVGPVDLPPNAWSVLPGVVRPASRGRIRLRGPEPDDDLEIDAGFLKEPVDMSAALDSLALGREIGNMPDMHCFSAAELLPSPNRRGELENFVRNAVVPQWHPSGTAKMGCDPWSVVDNRLHVYGLEGLMVADASVFPRIMTGNTMAPCVVVGERASSMLKADHGV